ncbi:MAG: D-alanyl-D-alanine carboxypeptidase [Clostridia bacterium]|nr:D-alanyl-D-alanine carboxypeptidase [Clostridia bacterium]
MRVPVLLLAATIVWTAAVPQTARGAELGADAKAALLMDAGSGTVLFEKNAKEHRAAGSVTKLMSILLFMEALENGQIHTEDKVTVSAFANSMGGSEIWLEVGEVMTVDDLLKAVIIQSANDATVALAEHVAGSEEAFLLRMNQRAAELGMEDTYYLNTTGFDEEGQYTCAYDIALVAQELLRHEKVFEYTMIWMYDLRGGKTQLANTNKLLKTYAGITGLKTGTTDDAGNCFCGTATRDGMTMISVVLGCSTSTQRFSSAAALMNYGFAGWESLRPALDSLIVPETAVQNGMKSTVQGAIVQPQTSLLLKRGTAGKVEYRLNMEDALEAPVEKGQRIGSAELWLGGEQIAEYPVLAEVGVNKITFHGAFFTLLQRLLCSMI